MKDLTAVQTAKITIIALIIACFASCKSTTDSQPSSRSENESQISILHCLVYAYQAGCRFFYRAKYQNKHTALQDPIYSQLAAKNQVVEPDSSETITASDSSSEPKAKEAKKKVKKKSSPKIPSIDEKIFFNRAIPQLQNFLKENSEETSWNKKPLKNLRQQLINANKSFQDWPSNLSDDTLKKWLKNLNSVMAADTGFEVFEGKKKRSNTAVRYISNRVSFYDVKAGHTYSFNDFVFTAKPIADRNKKPLVMFLITNQTGKKLDEKTLHVSVSEANLGEETFHITDANNRYYYHSDGRFQKLIPIEGKTIEVKAKLPSDFKIAEGVNLYSLAASFSRGIKMCKSKQN
tara:strand:- start:135 stop:1178 length:1044 start_codon:yes stop_codon:yes gene_type:complete